ncbi:hypothetical protein ACFU44_15105 [Nocardia rhizosphaerihabitans]|uniref:hypothetical protein n=1 Tax=Nocardia rhizosphaerihabitans TaxID=1691570 RepID=UPI0036725D31
MTNDIDEVESELLARVPEYSEMLALLSEGSVHRRFDPVLDFEILLGIDEPATRYWSEPFRSQSIPAHGHSVSLLRSTSGM